MLCLEQTSVQGMMKPDRNAFQLETEGILIVDVSPSHSNYHQCVIETPQIYNIISERCIETKNYVHSHGCDIYQIVVVRFRHEKIILFNIL